MAEYGIPGKRLSEAEKEALGDSINDLDAYAGVTDFRTLGHLFGIDEQLSSTLWNLIQALQSVQVPINRPGEISGFVNDANWDRIRSMAEGLVQALRD